jgi:hypothetical protein
MLMATLDGRREQQTAGQLQAIVPSSWAVMACIAGCSRALKQRQTLPQRSAPAEANPSPSGKPNPAPRGWMQLQLPALCRPVQPCAALCCFKAQPCACCCG